MTFTLTINGDSPAELLTALQQLNSSPAPQDKPKAPAPAKQKKAAQKPAEAPEKQDAPESDWTTNAASEERANPTNAPAQNAGAAATTDAPAATSAKVEPETVTTPAGANGSTGTPKPDSATMDKIRDLARSLIVNGKRVEVQQIIKGTGAVSISKLPADSYATVWQQLVNLSKEVDDHAAD